MRRNVEIELKNKSRDPKDARPNTFYCPEFVRFLTTYHAPHIAASSQIAHFIKFDKRPEIKPNRRNNQLTEEGFGQMKKALRADPNCQIGGRIDRNIVKLRTFVEGTLSFCDYGDNHLPGETPVRPKKVLRAPRSSYVPHSKPIKRQREEVEPPRAVKKRRCIKSEIDEAKVKISQSPVIQSQWGRVDPIQKETGLIRIAVNSKQSASPLSRSTERSVRTNRHGIVIEPTYYRRHLKSLRRYQPFTVNGAPISGVDLHDLCNPTREIWSDTMNILVQILSNRCENITVMPSYVSNVVYHSNLEDLKLKMTRSSSFTLNKPLPAQLFMPVTNGGHHYLCWADFTSRVFLCVDSTKQGEAEKNNLTVKFQSFIRYLALNQVQVNGWKAKIYLHLNQNDNVSCGIFVVKHAQQLLHDRKTRHEPFNPATYRNELFSTILEAADDMHDACLVCLAEKTVGASVECSICHRFVHHDCMEPHYSPVVQDVCELCMLFISE